MTMSQWLKFSLVLPLLLLSFIHTTYAQPEYAKWGKIAIEVTKVVYDNTDVKEYEYEGRNEVGDTNVKDSFKFLIQQNGAKKEILVHVIHDRETEKIISIRFEDI
jgi:hypothetical protein